MKKKKLLFSMLLSMLCSWVTYAQTILEPSEDAVYNIIHSSGFYFGRNDNSFAIIQAGNFSEAQQFKFTKVEGGYTIQQVSTGDYVVKVGGWDTKYVADPTEKNVFDIQLVGTGDEYVKFQELSSKGYLGTDQNAVNSGIYSNKPGNDGKHYWRIVEVSDEVVKDYLQTVIATAEGLLNSTVAAGDDVDYSHYPQAAYEALSAVLASAKAINDKANATQTEVNEAAALLDTEIENYKGSLILVEWTQESEMIVKIRNVKNPDYLLIDAGNEHDVITVHADSTYDGEYWKIIPLGSNTYNLQNVLTGLDIKVWAANDVYMGDPDSQKDRAIFNIFKEKDNAYSLRTNTGNGAYFILFSGANRKVGAQKGIDGSGYWTFEEVAEVPLMRGKLEKAIASATDFLESTTAGTEGGQYPQEAYDAMRAAIAAAQAVYDDATADQAAIDAAVVALDEALTAYKATFIIPEFTPKAGAKYRLRNYRYGTVMAIVNDTLKGEEQTSGMEGEWWEIEKNTDGETPVYILKNGNKAVKNDATLADYDSTDADLQWTMHYEGNTANGFAFAIQKGTDGAALVFGSATGVGTYNHVHSWNDQWFTFHEVDLPYDPVKVALVAEIAKAQMQLDTVQIGTVEGTYPQAAADAFQAVIAQAQTMVDETGHSQAEVDAMVETLRQAEATFAASLIVVQKGNLEAAILYAIETRDAAVVGNQPGQYYQSVIDGFSGHIKNAQIAADTCIVQADVEAAAEEMTNRTNEFKAAGHLDEVPMLDVLNDAIAQAKNVSAAAVTGINKGEYTAASKAAFDTVIAAAETAAATPGTDEQLGAALTELVNARKAFEASMLTVERTALTEGIADAETALEGVVAGDCNGQYPQEAIDALNEAITGAKTLLNDLTATQEAVDQQVTELKQAVTTFAATQVVIDFKALEKALAAAQKLIDNSEEGDRPGQFPTSAFEALRAVIAQAQEIDGSETVNQTTVNSMTDALNEAVETFKAAEIPTNKEALKAALDAANEVLAGAAVGEYDGNYPEIAVRVLRNAIATAQAVYDNEAALQEEIDAAALTLNEAVETFKTKKIVVDKSALQSERDRMVAELAGLPVGNEEGQYPQSAIDAFNQTLAGIDEILNSHEVTKDDVDAGLIILQAAWQTLMDSQISGEAIQAQKLNEMKIYAVNGQLHVSGAPAGLQIVLYDFNGRVVTMEALKGDVLSVELNRGVYIVKAIADDSVRSVKITVK